MFMLFRTTQHAAAGRAAGTRGDDDDVERRRRRAILARHTLGESEGGGRTFSACRGGSERRRGTILARHATRFGGGEARHALMRPDPAAAACAVVTALPTALQAHNESGLERQHAAQHLLVALELGCVDPLALLEDVRRRLVDRRHRVEVLRRETTTARARRARATPRHGRPWRDHKARAKDNKRSRAREERKNLNGTGEQRTTNNNTTAQQTTKRESGAREARDDFGAQPSASPGTCSAGERNGADDDDDDDTRALGRPVCLRQSAPIAERPPAMREAWTSRPWPQRSRSTSAAAHAFAPITPA